MRAVYACDVGSTRARHVKFAWVRIDPDSPCEVIGSSNIRTLASNVEHDLTHGRSVALGFEAPLFIPVPESADDLSTGRKGEGARSWSAPAGSTVAMLGLHQASWLLRKLFRSCSGACTFTLDPIGWPPTGLHPMLFCWEAFVSEGAHSALPALWATRAATMPVAHPSLPPLTTLMPFLRAGSEPPARLVDREDHVEDEQCNRHRWSDH